VSYDTEEQQIQKLKEWWKDNGTPLIVGAVLGLSGFGGWKYWQAEQVAYQAGASDLFSQVSDILQAEEQNGLSDSLNAVKTQYPNSTYAIFSALHLAKLAVDEKELDKAAQELKWVVENHSGNDLVSIAKIRLARVLIEQGQAEQALTYINIDADSGYSALANLVKGDALLALNKKAEALEAYKLANLDKKIVSRHPTLQFKIDALDNSNSSDVVVKTAQVAASVTETTEPAEPSQSSEPEKVSEETK
jgi:predicted negative regulator of RcsB-dependent stress response